MGARNEAQGMNEKQRKGTFVRDITSGNLFSPRKWRELVVLFGLFFVGCVVLITIAYGVEKKVAEVAGLKQIRDRMRYRYILQKSKLIRYDRLSLIQQRAKELGLTIPQKPPKQLTNTGE